MADKEKMKAKIDFYSKKLKMAEEELNNIPKVRNKAQNRRWLILSSDIRDYRRQLRLWMERLNRA